MPSGTGWRRSVGCVAGEFTTQWYEWGYIQAHVMPRRGQMDIKRVHRLCREEGLSLRLKRPRRNKAAQRRQPKQLAHAINDIRSMDLVAGALFGGRNLRTLTVVDLFTRECPGHRRHSTAGDNSPVEFERRHSQRHDV